jgi:serralysin
MGMPGQPRPVITWGNNAFATINVWAPYIRISGLAVTHPEPKLDPTARYNAGNSGIDAYSQVKADSHGVLRPTVHHVQFDNNVAFGSGCGGISFESVDYVLAYGNTVYGNAYAGGGHCSGISIYEAVNLDSKPGYHIVIADNFSFGNGNLYTIPGVTYVTDENGLIFDDSRNAQAKARSPNLPYIPYSGATLFFGNVIYGNGGRGVEVYTSDYVDIFNNVIYENLNDKELRNYPNCGGEILSGYSGHMRFENNIVVSYSPVLEVLSQIGVPADLQSNLWSHNISDVGLIALGKANSGNAQAAVGYGVNPMFVKPSATASNPIRDFNIRPASPAKYAGAPIAVRVTDIYGHSVAAGHPISIGAYVK